jgi:thioredoxin-dependent peroxiredoxin
MLEVGQQAPDFSAQATTGSTLSLGELRGRWVVLYFFPKAFTAG